MTESTSDKPSGSLGRFLGTVQAAWPSLSEGAVWICGIIAGFLLPPNFVGRIVGETITVENLSRLVQLIVALLIGVVFVVTRRSKRSGQFWAVSAVVTLILALGAFFLYLSLLESWTCRYAGTRIVTGSDLTPHGTAYLKANSQGSCETWVYDHAGEVEAIWTAGSIWHHEMGLLLVYIVSVPLFAFCIMSLLQAVAEANSGKGVGSGGLTAKSSPPPVAADAPSRPRTSWEVPKPGGRC